MSKYGDKYPWLRRKDWEDENDICEDGYAWDHFDDLPKGWVDAFGELLLEELDNAIKKAGYENEFVILQAKEKYGSMRLYHTPTNQEIGDIVSKYEVLSQNICCVCGKPDSYMLTRLGWISPFCEDCFNKHINDTRKYEEVIGENNKMEDTLKYRQYSKEFDSPGWKDFEIDISETAEKIRKRWEERTSKR